MSHIFILTSGFLGARVILNAMHIAGKLFKTGGYYGKTGKFSKNTIGRR